MVVNRQTGEVLLESNKPLTAEIWARRLPKAGIAEVDVFFPRRRDEHWRGTFARTLDKDRHPLFERGRLIENLPQVASRAILRRSRRPQIFFRGMFFDPRKYDFQFGVRAA